MNKKNILIVAHHLTVGGVQKSLLSALKAIDYDKAEVTLYLRKNRLDLKDLIDENVKLIVNDDRHHYYARPWAMLLQILILICKLFNKKKRVKELEKNLADYIRKEMMKYEQKKYFANSCFDIAISYVQGYNTVFVAEYICAKKKYVFYQVSTDELHEIHEKTFPYYDKIIVEHESIKELLQEWYDLQKSKLFVLENYIDYEIVRKQSEEYGIEKNNKKMICSCGRFAKVKGFDLAVESAKILRDKGFDFYWYLVGDGPEREKIEATTKKYRLEDYVKLTGMKKNPYPYIAACDVYVQPSYEEAISLSIMEAQIIGVPIVTTKTVGGMNMIQDGINGIQTEITRESLAEGIMRLLEDKDYCARIKNELLKVDYDTQRAEYMKKWNELLGV